MKQIIYSNQEEKISKQVEGLIEEQVYLRRHKKRLKIVRKGL